MAVEQRHAAVRRTDVTVRTAEEIRADQREAALRVDVALKVTLVTLFWLVSLSLLIGWEFSAPDRPTRSEILASGNVLAARAQAEQQPGGSGYAVAAVLAVLLPFVCAVIATRNRRFFLGGAYVVLTLVMIFPAVGMAHASG
jgi:hypothetical protein